MASYVRLNVATKFRGETLMSNCSYSQKNTWQSLQVWKATCRLMSISRNISGLFCTVECDRFVPTLPNECVLLQTLKYWRLPGVAHGWASYKNMEEVVSDDQYNVFSGTLQANIWEVPLALKEWFVFFPASAHISRATVHSFSFPTAIASCHRLPGLGQSCLRPK